MWPFGKRIKRRRIKSAADLMIKARDHEAAKVAIHRVRERIPQAGGEHIEWLFYKVELRNGTMERWREILFISVGGDLANLSADRPPNEVEQDVIKASTERAQMLSDALPDVEVTNFAANGKVSHAVTT